VPVNASFEYYKAEEKFLSAKNKEEKIACLEEMIRFLPSHKGTENVRAQLRKKLAKLKSEKTKKAGAKPKWSIKKEGAGQVCLFGLTNSGKSTLLKKLTGKNVEIAPYEYTTTIPQVGMMRYEDVWIQVVEIPSTFDPGVISIVHSTDLILIMFSDNKDMEKQKKKLNEILDKRMIKTKRLYLEKEIDIEKLKKEIWNNLGKIRVYTKTPGKKPETTPIVFKRGATVKNVVKEVHKEFLKHFRFANILGKSIKHGKGRVGLDHILQDKDIIEIRS